MSPLILGVANTGIDFVAAPFASLTPPGFWHPNRPAVKLAAV
jgi:hypothetical protein